MIGKSFKPEIFFTILFSTLVIVLLCVSMISEQWVTGTAKIANGTGEATYNYGLFNGYKTVSAPGRTLAFDLKIACGSSVCFYSCGVDGGEDLADVLSSCPYKRNFGDSVYCPSSVGDPEKPAGAEGEDKCESDLRYSQKDSVDVQMLPFAGYVMTVFFMILGLVFTLVGAIFGAINAFSNPIETIYSVYGLILWHGVAALCYLLSVLVWAGLFYARLASNVPISDTLRGPDGGSESQKDVYGFSFWLLSLCFLLHLVNLGVVGYYIYRKYKPKKRIVAVGHDNGPDKNVMLF